MLIKVRIQTRDMHSIRIFIFDIQVRIGFSLVCPEYLGRPRNVLQYLWTIPHLQVVNVGLRFWVPGSCCMFLGVDNKTYKLLRFFVVSSNILFKLLEETSHPSFTNFEIMTFYHLKNRRDFKTCQKLSSLFQNTYHFDVFYLC